MRNLCNCNISAPNAKHQHVLSLSRSEKMSGMRHHFTIYYQRVILLNYKVISINIKEMDGLKAELGKDGIG